jgi:cyclase
MTLPHLRIWEPHPNLFAYYDGRIAGYRFDPRPNWVDEGGIGLGISSFALIDDTEAVVYDTGTTPAHGTAISNHLLGRGVRTIRIIYSHWHKDHVAGTAQILAAFPNSPIIANTRTAAHLAQNQNDLQSSRRWPPIMPLILPTETFETEKNLSLGGRQITLIHHNIHSDDASVLWLPDAQILLAGDTLEDPITYVDEPQDFAHHIADLHRLKSLNARYILPCHGAPETIAAGGYAATLIDATLTYTHWLNSLAQTPENANRTVQDVLAVHFQAGHIQWYDLYNEVHKANVAAALKVAHG